jgi:hypothetical protein
MMVPSYGYPVPNTAATGAQDGADLTKDLQFILSEFFHSSFDLPHLVDMHNYPVPQSQQVVQPSTASDKDSNWPTVEDDAFFGQLLDEIRKQLQMTGSMEETDQILNSGKENLQNQFDIYSAEA